MDSVDAGAQKPGERLFLSQWVREMATGRLGLLTTLSLKYDISCGRGPEAGGALVLLSPWVPEGGGKAPPVCGDPTVVIPALPIHALNNPPKGWSVGDLGEVARWGSGAGPGERAFAFLGIPTSDGLSRGAK